MTLMTVIRTYFDIPTRYSQQLYRCQLEGVVEVATGSGAVELAGELRLDIQGFKFSVEGAFLTLTNSAIKRKPQISQT